MYSQFMNFMKYFAIFLHFFPLFFFFINGEGAIFFLLYLGKSNILQYFSDVRDHSAASDNFAVMWLTSLDRDMPSSPDTLQRIASIAWNTTSESTVLGLSNRRFSCNPNGKISVPTIFEQEIFLFYFYSIMFKFELVKHMFPI